MDGSGFIDVSEIRRLLEEVHGKAPSDREVELFFSAFDANRDRRVSWEEFVTGFEQIKAKLHDDVAGAREKPSWMPVGEAAKASVLPEPMRTSYGLDLGDGGGT